MGLLEYQAMPSFRDIDSLWWKVVYIYNITAARDSISSQLANSWQGNLGKGLEKAGSTARPSRTKSHQQGHFHPDSQAGRRVGPALLPSASLVYTQLTSYSLQWDT